VSLNFTIVPVFEENMSILVSFFSTSFFISCADTEIENSVKISAILNE
jgi:hypothetical protein